MKRIPLSILALACAIVATSYLILGVSSEASDPDDLDNFTLIDERLAVVSGIAEAQRTLDRFRKGKPLNSLCWNRSFEADGFLSPVDMHNHFQPFEGPAVPYDLYMDWMYDHGIRFTLMTGLGQRIVKTNEGDPNCCYYLHCPTFNYTVVPSNKSDILNADWYTAQYKSGTASHAKDILMLLSATFPSLQEPESNMVTLKNLEALYPNAFGWIGEINLVKYALIGNGFLNFPQTTEAMFGVGQPLSDFFKYIENKGWPVTIHNDIGCDTFEFIPGWTGNCTVEYPEQATANSQWWKDFLGIHYAAFFDPKTNVPRQNFRKIQNLKIFDTFLSTFPKLKVTWAHMGLSKELLTLHPVVHAYILTTFFNRHPLLYADVSWNIIAQLFLLNYDDDASLQGLTLGTNEDISKEAKKKIFTVQYSRYLQGVVIDLRKKWEDFEAYIGKFGSTIVTGPTLYLAIFWDLLHKYSTRFLTGTDFVASYATAAEWPGLLDYLPGRVSPGCFKTPTNHAGQLTDTSALNIFLKDDAFRNIVLGENFFRITGLKSEYKAPPVCSVKQSKGPGKKTSIFVGKKKGG